MSSRQFYIATSGFRLELGELIKIIRASSIPRDSELFRAALNRAESLAESSYFFPVPPRPPETDPQHWRNIGQSLLDLATTGSPHPALWTCALLASAYSTDDPVGFREALTNYYDWLAAHFAPTMRKANVEVLFNTLQPFHKAMVLYVFVFLLACTSWLVRRASLGRYALLLAGSLSIRGAFDWDNHSNIHRGGARPLPICIRPRYS